MGAWFWALSALAVPPAARLSVQPAAPNRTCFAAVHDAERSILGWATVRCGTVGDGADRSVLVVAAAAAPRGVGAMSYMRPFLLAALGMPHPAATGTPETEQSEFMRRFGGSVFDGTGDETGGARLQRPLPSPLPCSLPPTLSPRTVLPPMVHVCAGSSPSPYRSDDTTVIK